MEFLPFLFFSYFGNIPRVFQIIFNFYLLRYDVDTNSHGARISFVSAASKQRQLPTR